MFNLKDQTNAAIELQENTVLFILVNTINPNLGWLVLVCWLVRVCFEVGGGGGGKTTHCLKLFRIMLETSNLARKYTLIFSLRKYTFNTKAFLVLLISAFFATNQRFLAKIIPLLKAIVWELYYRFYSSVFSFCKMEGYY